MENKPPLIIDNAKVLEYAIIDSSIEYTGRNTIYYDGKVLGKVPALAICQNYKDNDYNIFYCDINWAVLGVGGAQTIEKIKSYAEDSYRGISSKWVVLAKPNDFENWPGNLEPICSFCGKSFLEIKQMIHGNGAHICNECITNFKPIINENENQV